MPLNTSLSANATYPPLHLFFSTNLYSFLQTCFRSSAGVFIIISYSITNILLLVPLCILILYMGLQRRQKQRSDVIVSHSDFFTYHIIIIELMSVLGCCFLCLGVLIDPPEILSVGFYCYSMNLSGQMLFHTLTCVERYLAVVHPITYLSLRKTKGIRMRNITIGCVWLISIARTSLMAVEGQFLNSAISICSVSIAVIVMFFCSLSVLCVLIRPRPGEGGGDRQQVDQSKLRAFYTIMTILGILLFRFGSNILGSALYASLQVGETEKCHVWYIVVWFSLPSSLVLPLLFLQRAGKLVCCKNSNTSGQGSD